MLGARLSAAAAGFSQVAVGVLYTAPEVLVRRPLTPGQVSAVVWIESFGPFWAIGFIATGLWLCVCALRKSGFVAAHIASSGWWAFYGGCIIFSALLTAPPAPVVSGVISAGVCLLNMAIARGDAERGYR